MANVFAGTKKLSVAILKRAQRIPSAKWNPVEVDQETLETSQLEWRAVCG